ncbi:hypothetical protein J4457_00190 [Candidatus Woesearchaeota archaeon]|nr:hypothetical protein [Candidatus Woesearchaeota archaeon]
MIPRVFLIIFLLSIIPSVSAVLDLRDQFYTTIAARQVFVHQEIVNAPPQNTNVILSGKREANTITDRSLVRQYNADHWRAREFVVREKVNPLTATLDNGRPSAVEWEQMKAEHRKTLLGPSQQRNLNEEYDDYWLERSLKTYQYLASQNPSLVRSMLSPLIFENLQEFLPYWVEANGKRSLAYEYDDNFWAGKEPTSRVTFTTE